MGYDTVYKRTLENQWQAEFINVADVSQAEIFISFN